MEISVGCLSPSIRTFCADGALHRCRRRVFAADRPQKANNREGAQTGDHTIVTYHLATSAATFVNLLTVLQRLLSHRAHLHLHLSTGEGARAPSVARSIRRHDVCSFPTEPRQPRQPRQPQWGQARQASSRPGPFRWPTQKYALTLFYLRARPPEKNRCCQPPSPRLRHRVPIAKFFAALSPHGPFLNLPASLLRRAPPWPAQGNKTRNTKSWPAPKPPILLILPVAVVHAAASHVLTPSTSSLCSCAPSLPSSSSRLSVRAPSSPHSLARRTFPLQTPDLSPALSWICPEILH